jgi:hypothetical protein
VSKDRKVNEKFSIYIRLTSRIRHSYFKSDTIVINGVEIMALGSCIARFMKTGARYNNGRPKRNYEIWKGRN